MRNKFKVSLEKYVVNKKIPLDIRYHIRNSQLIIDIKDMVDSIFDEEGIGKYKTDKMSINIPFDMNKQVSGNLISMIINNKRFLIRLKAMEILPSKQQKIDYDNTHPHRWTANQWVKFIEERFYETYGVKAMELDLRGSAGNVKRGKVFSNLKRLQNKILSLDKNMADKDIMDYIIWAFTVKSKKFNNVITLGSLQADFMIQDWLVYRKKRGGISVDGGNDKRKWKQF